MIYLVAILLFFLPIVTLFINKKFNIQITSHFILLGIFLCPLFIILMPLTLTQFANKLSIYIIFPFSILFSLIWLFFYIKKNKDFKINKIDYKMFCIELIPYILSFLLFFLFLIFTSYSDHDALYYINLSTNFSNGYYTESGILAENTQSQYLVPSMYYINGSIFEGDIILSYYLLNPMIVFITIYSIFKQIISILNIKNKFLDFFTSMFFYFGGVFLLISEISWTIGMNLVMQSLILLLIIVCFKKNENLNNIALMTFSLSYFSSTGLLLSVVSLFVLSLFYLFLKKNEFKTSGVIIWMIALVYGCFMLFLKIDNIPCKIILLIIGYLAFLFFVTIYFVEEIVYKDLLKWRHKITINLNNKSFLYSINSLYFVITIFQGIFFSFFYPLTYTPNWLLYISLICYTFILIYSIYFSIRKKACNNLILLLFSLLFIVLFSLSVQKALNNLISDNQSFWRLIYLCLGMGNLSDIIPSIILLLIIFISEFGNNYKNKILNFYNTKKVSLLLFSFIPLLVGSISSINIYSPLFQKNSPEKINFNKNVTLNFKKLSINDINLLKNSIKKFNGSNYSRSYFTDMPISEYFNEFVDVTTYFKVTKGKRLSSYKWNFNNLYNGINDWNDTYPNDPIEPSPAGIKKEFFSMRSSFGTYNIESITGKSIKTIDVIVLNKKIDYFSELNKEIISWNKKYRDNYNKIDGENICIYILE